MKHDLQKMETAQRERILAALKRLCQHSHDFQQLLTFFEFALNNRKQALITVSESQLKIIQGEAALLMELFELIEEMKNT